MPAADESFQIKYQKNVVYNSILISNLSLLPVNNLPKDGIVYFLIERIADVYYDKI
jgi:hypothetical protein